VLDAGLISAAQRVEHYEMAGYGTVRTYARQLGEEEQANLLQETLNEEGETDKLLTSLAESSINIEAEQADDEGMEGGGNGSGSGRSGGTRRRAATKRTKRATARR
jgi:hypothetical protein